MPRHAFPRWSVGTRKLGGGFVRLQGVDDIVKVAFHPLVPTLQRGNAQ